MSLIWINSWAQNSNLLKSPQFLRVGPAGSRLWTPPGLLKYVTVGTVPNTHLGSNFGKHLGHKIGYVFTILVFIQVNDTESNVPI